MAVAYATRGLTTPAHKLAAARRLQQLQSGEVEIPLACPTCYSTSLERRESDEYAWCVSCGRESKMSVVHTIRKQRITAFLVDGHKAVAK